jgi:hypothetical protein
VKKEKSVADEWKKYFIRKDFHRVFNHCPRSLFIYSESKIPQTMEARKIIKLNGNQKYLIRVYIHF